MTLPQRDFGSRFFRSLCVAKDSLRSRALSHCISESMWTWMLCDGMPTSCIRCANYPTRTITWDSSLVFCRNRISPAIRSLIPVSAQ